MTATAATPSASRQSAPVEERVRRLSSAAARRVIEPDEEVTGQVGDGQLLPDELLSVAGLGLELTPEQKARLSREEVASITQAGIRFEAVLEAGFGVQLATAEDLTDPRWTFVLHEVGEETRHQRLFQRLLSQLAPTARYPIPLRLVRIGYRLAAEVTAGHPALFYTLVLAGEEIPDLLQKLASEHPDTDEFVKAINKYHRMEEARHLSFARAVFPEVWEKASGVDRFLVREVAPRIIEMMFKDIVHPGVYAAIGLPMWRTWLAANATPERRRLRYQATRPIVDVLLECGALRRGRLPRAWRRTCGVDAAGQPIGEGVGGIASAG
jgi:hypothetical protein